MAKLFAGLFAAALLMGLGSAPTLTYAQDDMMEDAEDSMDTGDETMGDDSTMEEDTGSMDEAPVDPMEESEASE
ncbi:MAG TPA: hypothetical protein VMW68_10030 [Methyloceanibacter sp.]|nr:hypothetical protein [Methyloceanibacter sp.]